MDLIRRRLAILQSVGNNRAQCALPLDQLREIDQALANNWNIDFHDRQTLEDLLPRTAGVGPVTSYWRAHDLVAEALRRGALRAADEVNEALYDALADPYVFGPVTSSRRAFILDATALTIGLYEKLQLEGPVLDVGCHSGFTTQILASNLRKPIVGLDPSTQAIGRGRERILKDPYARLVVGRMPWDTEERFDLILAIDSMPDKSTEIGQFLRGIGNVLNPAGIAIVVSMHWIGADVERTRVHLKLAQLGFAYADVVGGYQGLPPSFDAECGVVFIKGAAGELPRKLREMSEIDWPRFRDYANSPSTPLREKTQAFERAARLQ